MRASGIALAIALLPTLGCGEDGPVQTRVAGSPTPTKQPTPTKTTPGTPPAERDVEEGPAKLPPLPKWDLSEPDFIEVEGQHRDPFRSYAKMFGSERGTRVGPQVPVLLSQYAIDDLRLMAIVWGAGSPRAMVVDPTGVGTILRRGDYVGRGDVVRGGADGSAEYEINWRVAKIRREDVVLAREDPASPTATPVTRILPLHPEGTLSAGMGPSAPP